MSSRRVRVRKKSLGRVVSALEDIRVFLFLHLVEAYLYVYVGLALMGARISGKRYAAAGAVFALFVYFVKGMCRIRDISPGSHAILLVLVLAAALRFVGRVDWDIAVGASLIPAILVLAGSTLMTFIMDRMGLSIRDITGNVYLYIAMGYVEDAFLFLALLLNRLCGVTLVDLMGFDKDDEA